MGDVGCGRASGIRSMHPDNYEVFYKMTEKNTQIVFVTNFHR